MCGGVGFKIKNIPGKELRRFFSAEEVDKFRVAGRADSFFWQKNAVLPIKTKKGIQLRLWGNKDENLHLPKTGWAKEESLKVGKWNYFHPEFVDIAVEEGCEKKIWFDLPQGTKGIAVKSGDEERVYMITKEADEEYQEITKHDREPLGKKNYRKVL